jgi:anti-anti-sigma factor
VLSIGWLIFISASPSMPVLGRKPGTQAFSSVEENPDLQTYPGLLVLRFDAGLFFASADALQERLSELAHDADPPLRTIVIDFEGINYIDSQGADTVAEVLDLASSHNIEIRLARVKKSVKQLLERDDVIADLGEEHIYGNVYEAVADKIDA